MTKWPTIRIKEIAEKVAMGPFGSNIKVETFVSAGVPIISGQHLRNSRLDESGGYKFITEAHADRLANSNVFPGDIVFTHAGTIGQVALIPAATAYDRYVISQRQFFLRVDLSKADPAFVTRWFHSAVGRHRLLMHASQVGVPSISRPASNLKTIEIELPTLREQKAISTVLDVLDDKIELNRRMNETLEALAQAIFKDWFVDFGPTRAKMEGRAPYLAPELWELFPDALDGEGKPVGWTIYTLSELAHHHRATLSPSAQPDRVYEHYSIPAHDVGNEPAIDLGSSIKSNKTIVPEGAVLLSKLNPEIERVWLPNPTGENPQVTSTEFLALTPLAPVTRSVLYCLFKSQGFRAEMTARVTGTSKSHQRVPPKSLLACEVISANPCLLALFDEKVSPMINRLLSNRRESRDLAQTRDLLLPKLMSGEIRLREEEKVVEAVA